MVCQQSVINKPENNRSETMQEFTNGQKVWITCDPERTERLGIGSLKGRIHIPGFIVRRTGADETGHYLVSFEIHGTKFRRKFPPCNLSEDIPLHDPAKCPTPTDPKKQAGDLKHPLHLLPTVALVQTAHVLKLGADKYGVYNWRESADVKASTYTAAIFRHLVQYMDGEDVDEESGKSHLAHIMATCSILLDADSVDNVIDDRAKKPTPPLAP